MEVAVIGGTGYVGLVTGIGLAHLGHRVRCADVDVSAIERLKAGHAPIREAGMERMLASALKRKRISFTTDVVQAAADADVVIIAVGTPMAADGKADLSQIESAADRVALGLELASRAARRPRSGKGRPRKTIAVKSTVPVGTCEALRDRIRSRLGKAPIDFDVVSNPEFLREGSAVKDFMRPDRIVVGAYRRKDVEIMRRLYRSLEAPLVVMDPRSSEMLKYACNSYLGTRLSFINEIAAISEAVGADVRRVIEGMRLDPRIGPGYLAPGMGFGGPCLVKDISSLASFGAEAGGGTVLLDAVLSRNAAQADAAVAALASLMGGLVGKRVAILGLSFKEGTADTRDSPSLLLARRLEEAGAKPVAWDPLLSAQKDALSAYPILERGLLDAARASHCLILMNDGIGLDARELARLAQVMASPAIYDTRRKLDLKAALAAGFTYRALGVSPRRLKSRTRASILSNARKPALNAAIAL